MGYCIPASLGGINRFPHSLDFKNKTIPFIVLSKKYLGLNLTKAVKDLYNEITEA